MSISMTELSAMEVGDAIRIPEGSVHRYGSDYFVFTSYSGYSNTGTVADIYKAIQSNPANWTTGTLSTASVRIQPRLTVEEEERLLDLESQLRAHIKFEQLNIFKRLPRHLRQDVVDEAYLNDLVNDMDEGKHKSSFQFKDELESLRCRRYNSSLYSSAYTTGLSGIVAQAGKYYYIISKFSTEELARAHAEVCLEEDLAND